MTTVSLPDPVLRPPPPASASAFDTGALEADLRTRVHGEVRFDRGTRAAYSTDASNYRQVPIGVVLPYEVETVVDVVQVCREHGVPLLSRGGGTSLAGECTNAAVVIDFSKYCNRLLSVDAEHRTCVVEPGIVLDHLNDLLRDHDIEFGPEPATHNHCTLGGMLGNNSCGATAQRTGKTVDNIQRLDVLLYDGTRMWVGETPDDEYEQIIAQGGRKADVYRQLRELRDHYADDIRHEYPDIPRRVSGYCIDSLLSEKGFHVAQALVGSESTLVTVLRAELKLVPRVHERALVMIGFPDIGAAGDAVPAVLPAEPIALEAMDDKLIKLEKEKHLNPKAVKLLPDAGGYLMVQMGGETRGRGRRERRPHAVAARQGSRRQQRRLLRRPRARERVVAGARVRSRRDRADSGLQRCVAGVGGLGGRTSARRKVRARPAKALRRVRLRRSRDLRPLRTGMHPLPDPVRAADGRRHRAVPFVRGAGGRPRRLLRRFVLG